MPEQLCKELPCTLQHLSPSLGGPTVACGEWTRDQERGRTGVWMDVEVFFPKCLFTYLWFYLFLTAVIKVCSLATN